MNRPDGILIEFYPLGAYVKVSAIDPVTLTEVSIVGDPAAGEDALSRAAMRNVSPTTMEYPVSVEGAKPGPAIYDVEASNIEKPQGVRIVSRSPARIEVKFEVRGRKNVRIRTDIEGEPAEGFVLGDVVVEPERVWLSGARSDVLRLNEVVTETIDITGIRKPLEKEVRLSLGGGVVWVEGSQPVRVKIQVDPVPAPEPEPGTETAPQAEGGTDERTTG